MFRTLKSPLNVQVEITERCNQVCRHCYNFFRHRSDPCRTMGEKDLDGLVDQFQQCQVIRVVLTGGEPLVVPELTYFLAKRCIDSGMSVTLNSNLTKFDQLFGERLQKIGVTTIMTSLLADEAKLHDQITQVAGSWNLATNNIQLAIKMGFRVLVNMVLTKWNISRVRQTGNLVGSWGAAKFGATRACAPGPIAKNFSPNLISLAELRESLNLLYELQQQWGYDVDVFEHYPWCALQDVQKYRYLARRKCTAGITSASVGADGQLRPCGHSSMKYGNVLTEGLATPWERMDNWRKQEYVGKCRSCRFLNICTGGCPVEAGNSPDDKDHHCTSSDDVVTLPTANSLPPVYPGQDFDFLPSLILRKETFGGIIAGAHEGLVFVDETAFSAISTFAQQHQSVRIESLTKLGATDTEAEALLARLRKERLIVERR